MPDKDKSDIHKVHRKRLRQQFIENGADSMEDHVLLEFLLFYALPRINTNELAHELINHFGSFSEVLDAPYEELLKVDNIAENSATLIKLIPALSRRYAESKRVPEKSYDTPQKIGEYFVDKFIGEMDENVYVMLLDSSLQLIKCALLTKGSVSSANVNIRSIVDLIVRHNACAVALAHNHPRGLAMPSTDDLLVTTKIRQALKPMDVRMIEHIVVAQNDYIPIVADGYVASE